MARKLRIQYPGAMHHLMNHGDHQETIFCDEDDRKLFVATLAEGCQKTGFQIHSFCLIPRVYLNPCRCRFSLLTQTHVWVGVRRSKEP